MFTLNDKLKSNIRKDYTVIQKRPLLYRHLFLYAVKFKNRSIAYIPSKYFTKKLVDDLMDLNPDNIRWIPYKYKTAEICQRAFEHDPSNIMCVTDKFVSDNLAEIALQAFDNDQVRFIVGRIELYRRIDEEREKNNKSRSLKSLYR